MPLDAIIISDTGEDSLSATNSLKLQIGGKVADIQTVKNFAINGKLSPPIDGDGVASWIPRRSSTACIYTVSYSVTALKSPLWTHSMHRSASSFDCYNNPHGLSSSRQRLSTTKKLWASLSTQYAPTNRKFQSLREDSSYITRTCFEREPARMVTTRNKLSRITFFLDPPSDPKIDLIIIGPRGEDTLKKSMTMIFEGRPVAGLPNTAVLDGQSYRFGTMVEDTSLQWGNPIDWAELPDSVFASSVIPMQASIGCSFHCTFCNFVKNPKLTAIKPLDQLISDMKEVAKRGIRYIWFTDDNFRLGSSDLNSVCQRIVDEGLDIQWISFVRASALLDVDYSLMRKAGCYEVQLGLESATWRSCKTCGKKQMLPCTRMLSATS